jgi:hypothetical protein
MEADPAQQCLERIAIPIGIRPHLLEASRELCFFGMGIGTEHESILTKLDTGREKKTLKSYGFYRYRSAQGAAPQEVGGRGKKKTGETFPGG